MNILCCLSQQIVELKEGLRLKFDQRSGSGSFKIAFRFSDGTCIKKCDFSPEDTTKVGTVIMLFCNCLVYTLFRVHSQITFCQASQLANS